MSPTHINNLKSLFPDLDTGVIIAVYNAKSKNFEKAVEALLSMNTTTLSSSERVKIASKTCIEVIDKVMKMPRDTKSKRLAGKYGLDIMNVTWEDSARTKGSIWGPCISDMTLNVDDKALPVIRYPNYEDLTWDVPMNKIPLVVGNEVGSGELYTVSLKEYLDHFRMYLSNPTSWKGSNSSLLSPERDSHVIMSSQACMLPVPKRGEAKFNVSLYNYQSRSNDPAVLAIVATSQGTSTQIVNGSRSFWGGQKLYFNKQGEKASFIGKRLSDDRRERGVSTTGAMTTSEKQQNMIMIIQVPLKQKTIRQRKPTLFYDLGEEMDSFCTGGINTSSTSSCIVPIMKQKECMSHRKGGGRRRMVREKADVEDAIIKVGETEGAFTECGDLSIERDSRYPVRVTLQYYKSTANGIANDTIMKTIAKQIENSRKFADNVGSLVVSGRTSRPTEHIPTHPIVVYPSYTYKQPTPSWWSSFWLTYRNIIPHDELTSKTILFTSGRIPKHYTMEEAKDRCLRLLGAHVRKTPLPHPIILPYPVDPIYFDESWAEDLLS